MIPKEMIEAAARALENHATREELSGDFQEDGYWQRSADAALTAALSVQLEHLDIDAALRIWYPTLNEETLRVVKARGAGDLLREAIIAALPLPPPTASKE